MEDEGTPGGCSIPSDLILIRKVGAACSTGLDKSLRHTESPVLEPVGG